MASARVADWREPDFWSGTITSLAPLWLVSFAIMIEGFPPPPFPPQLAILSFFLAIAGGLVFFWKGWIPIELLPYGFLPLGLLYVFDEISTTYKTPFIVLCALLLSVGIAVFQSNVSTRVVRLLILVAVALGTFALAQHAQSNFWQMASDLGYVRCMPDLTGCAPLTGQEPSPWVLFFRY